MYMQFFGFDNVMRRLDYRRMRSKYRTTERNTIFLASLALIMMKHYVSGQHSLEV